MTHNSRQPEGKSGGPMWFSYDRENNEFSFHATEEDARKEAEAILDRYRDEAGDGWPEGLDGGGVGYGFVTHESVKCNVRTLDEWESTHTTEDERDDDPWPCEGFDEVCDYRLEKATP